MKVNSKKFLKNGLVASPDFKFTGDEPTWKHVKTKEELFQKLTKALNFYNYYLDRDDYIPIIAEYMKNNGYDKKQIALLKSIPKTNSNVTVCGKLARMYNMGMPKITDHEKQLKEYLSDILRSAQNDKTSNEDVTEELQKKKTNPHEIMKKKVQTNILHHLEVMLDEWAKGETKVNKFLVSSQLRANNIPVAALGDVIHWIEKQLNEYNEAYNKDCDQMVEGYSYLSKPALKNRIKALEDMFNDLKIYKSSKNADRKPRVKKPKSADKQIAKMKYLTESKEYAIKSIDPVRIIGGNTLFVFNTKYRRLTIFNADGRTGFSVKGTTIEGFNKDSSYCMTLRKPQDALIIILTKTEKQIEKYLSELKTQRKPANGRINQDTILMKIL